MCYSESDSVTSSSVLEGMYQVIPESVISNRKWRNMLRQEPYSSRLAALVAHCVEKWLCAHDAPPSLIHTHTQNIYTHT